MSKKLRRGGEVFVLRSWYRLDCHEKFRLGEDFSLRC
jgi:hypothetical protein